MIIPEAVVNPLIEPSMFPPEAIRVVLEVLIDRVDDTAVISLLAVDGHTGKLQAFVSRGCPLSDVEAQVRSFGGPELTKLLSEHAGPF